MGREKKFSRLELWDATRTLILEVGYLGFTFSLLANRLDVSRAAIYKQFHNKEDLIMDFMVHEMEYSIQLLQSIDLTCSFDEQIEDLLRKMYTMKDVHQALSLATVIPITSDYVSAQKQKLGMMHRDLYAPLVAIIECGKREGKIALERSSAILLGFVFQAIEVPNFERLSEEQLIQEIKQFILYGLTGEQIV